MPDHIQIGNCTCITRLAKFLLSTAIDDAIYAKQKRITDLSESLIIKESYKEERIKDLRSNLGAIRELRRQIQLTKDCP